MAADITFAIKNFIDAFAYNGGANVAKMVVVIIGAFTQNRRANVAIVIVVIVKALAKAFAAHFAKVIGIIIAFAKAFAAEITIVVKRIDVIALGHSLSAVVAEMCHTVESMLAQIFPAIEIADVITIFVITKMLAATKVTIGIFVLIPAIMLTTSIVAFGIPIVICAFTKIGICATIVAPMVQILIHANVINGFIAIVASTVFICVYVLTIVIFATVIAFVVKVRILANAD